MGVFLEEMVLLRQAALLGQEQTMREVTPPRFPLEAKGESGRRQFPSADLEDTLSSVVIEELF